MRLVNAAPLLAIYRAEHVVISCTKEHDQRAQYLPECTDKSGAFERSGAQPNGLAGHELNRPCGAFRLTH
jgi:hypothetical protein